MKTIIHDLNTKDLKEFQFDEGDTIINSRKCQNSCIGCFSCWTKHPARCMYHDEYSNIADSLKKSHELVIISKNRYGCYSHIVKRVLERCIGYVLPHFTIRKGRIHHISRYDDKINLVVYFYGNITDEDKKCLYSLVKANAINLNTASFKVNFMNNIKEVSNAYID